MHKEASDAKCQMKQQETDFLPRKNARKKTLSFYQCQSFKVFKKIDEKHAKPSSSSK